MNRSQLICSRERVDNNQNTHIPYFSELHKHVLQNKQICVSSDADVLNEALLQSDPVGDYFKLSNKSSRFFNSILYFCKIEKAQIICKKKLKKNSINNLKNYFLLI